MPSANRRLHVIIHGIVQGVGYRMFAQREARRLSLEGWVKNLRDGSVEVVAEGSADQLNTLLERLRIGPPGGTVFGVNIDWEQAEGGLGGFSIRY